jgi:glycosyltransferase involved in cell wall biosynthesis
LIRVGFVLSATHSGWTGGLNYFSNLLHAILKVANRQIEPVLVVHPTTTEKVLAQFPRCEVHRTPLADSGSKGWGLARKLAERGLGSDVLMTRYLRSQRLAVLSHAGQLGARARFPTLGWLPDFQHRRMPEFFDAHEVAARDKGYGRIAEQCTTVLLSSVDAQNDLAAFVPAAVKRSRVLHFVAGFAAGNLAVVDEATLRARYAIHGPYFHLPNQFWVHKNHRVVIDALALLKAQGQVVQVLCTGHTQDARQPDYFNGLMQDAKALGVEDSFRVLGLVPYEDLAGLMHHATAVINPSLFEGWSTSVEESKSLGLKVVLSDIPVHREQAPERGVFFTPTDATSLAQVLNQVQEAQGKAGAQSEEQAARADAQARLPARFAAFGEQYQAIVIDTLARA